MARNFDLSIRLKAVVEGLKEIGRMADEIHDVGNVSDATASQAADLTNQLDDLRATTSAIGRFEALQGAIADTGDELERARTRSAQLATAIDQVAEPTQDMRREYAQAREEVQRLERAQADLAEQSQAAGRRLEQMGMDSRDLASNQDRLEQRVDDTRQAFDDLTGSIREARGQASRSFDDPTKRLHDGAADAGHQLDALTGRIKTAAATAAGSVAAFFGIRDAIEGIVKIADVGANMESLETRLASIMGSIEGGKEATAWIQDFTRNTPFALNEVTDAFIRAKAFGMDPMNGTLQAIADQAAQTGGGMEALTGITTALGQAYAKQKLQAEEILQLVERGVPAWDLLSEATGKNVRELQALSTAGELGRREIDLLIQAIGGRAAGAAADQMDKLGGIVSNLRDSFRQFIQEVNRQGFLDYLKGELSALQERFNEARKSGELKEWAQRISDALVGLGRTVKGVATALIEYRDAIALVAKAWVAYKGAQAAAGLLKMAANLRTKTIPAVTAYAEAVETSGKRTKGLSAAIGAIPGPAKFALLAVAISELPGLLEQAGTAIGNWAGQYSSAARHLEETRQRLREQAQSQIASTEEEIRQAERYRDVQAQSRDAVIKMSDEQRAAYQQQLQGLKDLQVLEYRLAMLREQTGQDTTERQQELAAALKDTRQALDDVATAAEAVAQGANQGLSQAATAIVEQFRQMRADGDDAAKAIKSVFSSLEAPGDFGQVQAVIQALSQIQDESRDARDAITDQLGKALQDFTGEQLQTFVVTLNAAFAQGGEFAGQFAETARAAADAAFRNLGGSLREFETGISDAERSAIDSFRALEDAGVLTSKNLGDAFAQLTDDIKSPEAVREVEALLDGLEERGIEVSDKVRKAFTAMAEGVKGTSEATGKEIRDAIAQAGDEETLSTLTDRLLKAWRDGKIGVDEYRQALADLQDKHREVAASAEAAAGKAKSSLEDTAQAAKDAGDAAQQAGAQAEQSKGGWISYQKVLESAGNGMADLKRNSAQAMRYSAQFRDRLLEQARAWQRNQQAQERARYGLEDLYAVTRDYNGEMQLTREQAYQVNQELKWMAEVSGRSVQNLLDMNAADLSQIRDQAAQLRGEIDSLNDSLGDTVSRLEQQLASLRGDREAAQRLRYQEQQAELQKQLNKARELGDQEAIASAREALDLAQQINAEKLKEIRVQSEQEARQQAQQDARDAAQAASAESEQRDQQAFQRTQTASINRATTRAAQSINERTVTINLDAFGERLGSLSGVNEDQANALLESIERGQFTAAR